MTDCVRNTPSAAGRFAAARPVVFTALLAVVAVGSVVYAATPGAAVRLPPCPFHWATGLNCPGCGTGRGLHLLAHGDLLGALRMNPLMMVALPFVLYAGVAEFLRAWGGRTVLRPLQFSSRASWMIMGVIITYWVLRNVPSYPFTLLAPH